MEHETNLAIICCPLSFPLACQFWAFWHFPHFFLVLWILISRNPISVINIASSTSSSIMMVSDWIDLNMAESFCLFLKLITGTHQLNKNLSFSNIWSLKQPTLNHNCVTEPILYDILIKHYNPFIGRPYFLCGEWKIFPFQWRFAHIFVHINCISLSFHLNQCDNVTWMQVVTRIEREWEEQEGDRFMVVGIGD